jgi:hypothetical protein
MKDILKRYWPTIITIAAGAAAFLTPAITAYASAHPSYSVPLMTIWGVVLHNLSAPKDN